MKKNISPVKKTPPASIDAYLAMMPEEVRETLQTLRKRIRAAAPAATEVISYQIPTFRYHGQPLVAFAGYSGHCGLYTISKNIMARFSEELAPYQPSGVTVRFATGKSLPAVLVKKIVKARMAEIDETLPAKKKPAKKSAPKKTVASKA